MLKPTTFETARTIHGQIVNIISITDNIVRTDKGVFHITKIDSFQKFYNAGQKNAFVINFYWTGNEFVTIPE